MANEKAGFPSDTADKFIVRLPDGMRDRLKKAAARNNRTMNSEIVSRLQASLDQKPNIAWVPGGSPRDLIGRTAADEKLLQAARQIVALAMDALAEEPAHRPAPVKLSNKSANEADRADDPGATGKPDPQPSRSVESRKRLRR